MRYVTVKLERSERESMILDLPPWEVAVLQTVHTPAKIQVIGSSDAPEGTEYPVPYQEYDRLAKRYKDDPSTGVDFVAIVYGAGPLGLDALQKQIEKAAEADRVYDRTERAAAAKKVAEAKQASDAIAENAALKAQIAKLEASKNQGAAKTPVPKFDARPITE